MVKYEHPLSRAPYHLSEQHGDLSGPFEHLRSEPPRGIGFGNYYFDAGPKESESEGY